MNEQQLQSLTAQLADIAMPPAPNWQPVIIAVVLFTVFILTTALMLYVKKTAAAPATQTNNPQTQLDALCASWKQGQTSHHDAAYQIATLLRQKLKLRQLKHTPPTLLKEEKAWRDVVERLDTLRYRNTGTALDETIFEHARRWLTVETSQ